MEEDQQKLDRLKKEMRSICQSKAEEFHLLGYEHVTRLEIWECISNTYHKEIPALHKVVNDILSLSVTKFMNWMTMKMYRGEI